MTRAGGPSNGQALWLQAATASPGNPSRSITQARKPVKSEVQGGVGRGVSATIDDAEATSILLSTATEGGSGLYEAVWELNSRFPDASLSEKYRAAAAALRQLYRTGFIELYREHLSGSDSGRFEPFQPPNLDQLLENPVTWYPEYDGVQLGFAATPAGIAHYQSL